MLGRAWRRIRRVVIQKILHLNDTPHRIAFGVFLGFVVGWTPTMGAQILLYWIFASILRANKASGVLPVLLTNPITAVPVYFTNWKIGQWILHPGGSIGEALAEQKREKLNQIMEEFGISRIFEPAYWDSLVPAFKSLGLELLVGCLVVGLICGSIGYVATFYGVLAYRRRRAAGRRPAIASSSPADSGST